VAGHPEFHIWKSLLVVGLRRNNRRDANSNGAFQLSRTLTGVRAVYCVNAKVGIVSSCLKVSGNHAAYFPLA